MKPKQRPGRFYGQTDGETINDVAAYLSTLVTEGNLPEKALVFHQVNRGVLKDEVELKPLPGVAFIKSVDGLGPVHSKIETYDYLMTTIRHGVHPGFKLFFDEDSRERQPADDAEGGPGALAPARIRDVRVGPDRPPASGQTAAGRRPLASGGSPRAPAAASSAAVAPKARAPTQTIVPLVIQVSTAWAAPGAPSTRIRSQKASKA